MYKVDWKILFEGKKVFKLNFLQSVEIHESVDILSDTAVIKLPGSMIGKQLEVETKLKVGDKVTIELGYNGNLKTEFKGFLQSISTDDGSITLTCEDGIYQTRISVKDKEFVNCTSKDVAQYVVDQVNLSLTHKITLICDCEMKYDKFVVSKANGHDVLSKLQEESKGNIYMKGNELHFHHAYLEKFGETSFDFFMNIEKNELKYRRADDRKFEVEVEGIGKDGKRTVVPVGTTGGEKRSVKISGVTDKTTLQKRGEEELKYLVFDGYEGSFTGWLIPDCHPGYSCKIKDQDYEFKSGTYYVVAVTTTASESGVSRKVELGRELA
ncbi:MAG: hypothetical protein WCL00_00125 [Bacteroidota bacterium]